MSLSSHISLEGALSAVCKLPIAALWDTFFCHVMTFKNAQKGKNISHSPKGPVLGIGTPGLIKELMPCLTLDKAL